MGIESRLDLWAGLMDVLPKCEDSPPAERKVRISCNQLKIQLERERGREGGREREERERRER